MSLLRAMPAASAFRREAYRLAPPEAGGWLGALSVTARHPDGLRPSELADVLHVDLSVASRHVAHLEELGYVQRSADPNDGRATIITATEAGRAWTTAFASEFADHLQHVLAEWSDDDVTTLTTLLQRFGASIERASANRTEAHA